MNRFTSWYRIQPKALRALLTINVVIYVVWVLVLVHIAPARAFVWEHLALNPGVPGIFFEPWQLITYNFLHLGTGLWGFIHILFNLLWLVWIGREYEELHGSHKLLALYLLGGLGGGLLTVLLHAIFPGVGAFGGVVHGASASVLGVITAVAVLYPYKSIALLLIGTVRLVYVVIAFLVLDLLFLSGGGTSVSAHFGGALFGLLYARAERRGVDLASWAKIFFRTREKRRRPAPAPEDGDSTMLEKLERWLARRSRTREPQPKKQRTPSIRPFRSYTPEPDEPVDALESEVDRILDKISEHGYDALTDEEKRILYEASRR